MFGYPSLWGWKGFAGTLLNMNLAVAGAAKSPDCSQSKELGQRISWPSAAAACFQQSTFLISPLLFYMYANWAPVQKEDQAH